MRIFFFTDSITVILFFILWAIFQTASAVICLRISDSRFSPESFLFRPRRWERGGLFYERVFKVRRWKRFLPDGGAIVKGGYEKKHLGKPTENNLERFAIETSRGELTHWLAILPFWVFGFFAQPIVILYMFIYALAVNAPCIITQRYNRPRIIRLLKRLDTNAEAKDTCKTG
jgi:glycosyl-4,4'-diaponeurosporenoate acyltransferase